MIDSRIIMQFFLFISCREVNWKRLLSFVLFVDDYYFSYWCLFFAEKNLIFHIFFVNRKLCFFCHIFFVFNGKFCCEFMPRSLPYFKCYNRSNLNQFRLPTSCYLKWLYGVTTMDHRYRQRYKYRYRHKTYLLITRIQTNIKIQNFILKIIHEIEK